MTATSLGQPKQLAGNLCTLHRTHGSARPSRTVKHHVWPLGMGGPNIPENEELTCDNGHYSVHALILWMYLHVTADALSSEAGAMNRDKTNTRYLLQLISDRFSRATGGSRTERKLAVRGYLDWHNAGRPPAHPERLDPAANSD